MFPSLRQRLLMLATVVAGAVGWLAVWPLIQPVHGDAGLLLAHSSVGPLIAVGAFVLAGLPCLLLGLVTAARGNPLSGVFGVAFALLVVSWSAGGAGDWFHNAMLPGAYNVLMMELIGWQGGLVALLMLIQVLRSPMRQRIPALAFDDHLGVDTSLNMPHTQSLLAGVICAAVSGVLAYVLIRNASTGQVHCALLLAFTVGGMVAHLIARHDNPVGILFSPALVATVGYTWVIMAYDTTPDVINALHRGELPGLALALPAHYTSAAVVGCTIGLGWAEALIVGERRDQPAAVGSS